MYAQHNNPNDEPYMFFQPKSETELREERESRKQLLDIKATYDFEVTHAEERVSKNSGKDMLVLTLKVYHDGGSKVFTDYIVCDQQEKLFSLCKSCDLLDEYHAGEIGPDNFAGVNGKCKLGIEKGSAAPDGGFYPDKNKVRQYVSDAPPTKATHPATAAAATTRPVAEDDDIPF